MANLQPLGSNSAGSKLNPSNLKTIIPREYDTRRSNTVTMKKFFDSDRYNNQTATVANAFDSNPIRTFDFIVQRLSGK